MQRSKVGRFSSRILSQIDVDALTGFAEKLARAAGEAILPHFRSHLEVENKELGKGSGWDPVTVGDRAAEEAIRALITQNHPDHGILGEEFGRAEGKSDFTWIIDPIDGTRAFVIGMPTWATLIGLYYQDQPLIGIMCQPLVGDMFIGNPHGAWLDHRGTRRALQSSRCAKLERAQAGTTAPHLYKDQVSARGLERLQASCQALRFGGDAYFFALVAAGHMDLALDCGLQIYDLAALIPIVEGAGGVVGSWDTDDITKGGNLIVAGNQPLLDAARECFNR